MSGPDSTLTRRTLLGGGLGAAVAGLAACSTERVGVEPALPAGPDIVVGACLELTGASAIVGTSAQRGLEVALDEINAVGLRVGGKLRRVKLIIEDNKSDAATAVDLTSKLISADGVSAIIGGAAASTSTAMSAVAEKRQVTMISLASADSIVKPVTQHRFVFKLGPDAYTVADLIAAHLAAHGVHSVGLLAESSPHGDAGLAAFLDSARQNAVNVPVHARLPLTTTRYSTQAEQMAAAQVSAVVIWSQAPTALNAATALRHSGYLGSLYFDTGAAADDAVDLKNSAVMGGGMFVAPEIMSAGSEIANGPASLSRKTFFNDFTRRYGAISTFAIFSADALRMVGTAAERAADPTRLRVRNGLESAPLYLLGGSYTFSTINHGGVQPDQLALLQLGSTGWLLT